MQNIYKGKQAHFSWAFCSDTEADGVNGPDCVKLLPNHLGKIKVLSGAKKEYKADGLLVSAPAQVVKMKTADCIPVIVWWDNTTWSGVLHLGFKGFFTGTIKNFSKQAQKLGLEIKQANFAFGPHICSDCYSHQTPKRRIKWFFLKRKFPCRATQKDGQLLFDLAGAYIDNLVKAGVKQENISIDINCTNCNLGVSRHYHIKDRFILTTLEPNKVN